LVSPFMEAPEHEAQDQSDIIKSVCQYNNNRPTCMSESDATGEYPAIEQTILKM